jgi:hypothetical protein
MFRAQSAHHQEVNDANCTYAASGIVTLCKLYYAARPTKYQDLHCETSKTDIPVQEDQNKIVQKQCGHLVQQNLQSPSLAVAQDGHLQRVTIPEAAYVQFASLIS